MNTGAYSTLKRIFLFLVPCSLVCNWYNSTRKPISRILMIIWNKDSTVWDFHYKFYEGMAYFERTCWPVKRLACHVCFASWIMVKIGKPLLFALMDRDTRSRMLFTMSPKVKSWTSCPPTGFFVTCCQLKWEGLFGLIRMNGLQTGERQSLKKLTVSLVLQKGVWFPDRTDQSFRPKRSARPTNKYDPGEGVPSQRIIYRVYFSQQCGSSCFALISQWKGFSPSAASRTSSFTLTVLQHLRGEWMNEYHGMKQMDSLLTICNVLQLNITVWLQDTAHTTIFMRSSPWDYRTMEQ